MAFCLVGLTTETSRSTWAIELSKSPSHLQCPFLMNDRARIVGVSFGDVDPFSLEAVEYYEKALINAQEQGTRIKDAGVALKAMEEKMTKTLLKEKIFVTSGSDFGTDVSGWYRIVFAHERTYLLEGLERMVRAVKEFGHDSSR
jgi:hypothetical protein